MDHKVTFINSLFPPTFSIVQVYLTTFHRQQINNARQIELPRAHLHQMKVNYILIIHYSLQYFLVKRNSCFRFYNFGDKMHAISSPPPHLQSTNCRAIFGIKVK